MYIFSKYMYVHVCTDTIKVNIEGIATGLSELAAVD